MCRNSKCRSAMARSLLRCCWMALSILTAGGALLLSGSEGAAFTQENAPAGSCDVHQFMGFCYEFVGAAANEAGMKSECDSANGIFAPAPCSREGVLGTCVFDPEGKVERRIIYYFYADSFTLKSAKMSCPGTFYEQ